MTKLGSISISARITLDMHSLNNEGAEGNQLQARMVHIVDEQGELQVVNAISGDMLKHIQAEYFHAVAREAGLPLCTGCQVLNANRINADLDFIKGELGDIKDNAQILDKIIQHCALDDAEGVLITEGNRSAARKSTVEFGWLVGLPEKTRTESYFHVKFDHDRGQGSGSEDGSNLGQNIFYRPASSGVYALVLNVEASRVGFNDVSREYVVDETERKKRLDSLLRSITFTLLNPKGAHRNTQFPHIVDMSGVVTVSRSSVPAPTASPLNNKYVEEIKAVTDQINRFTQNSIEIFIFNAQSEFAKIMANLIERL